MPEIQVGDKVIVRPALKEGPPRLGVPDYIKTREYLVVDIEGEDVLLRTVSVQGRFWEAIYEKFWFRFVDGVWRIL